MEELPTELVLEIPQHLVSLRDVASLARVTRRLHCIINPVLYRLDAASGNAAAPFWAAEQGLITTLDHARSAGADLDETRLFTQPRGHASSSLSRSSVDIPHDGDQPATVAAAGGSFLDWAAVAAAAAAGPRFWWHPLDVAALYGHADVVRYLAGKGVSVTLSRSRGLCKFSCCPPVEGRGGGARLDWAIHSAAQIAACAGHGHVVDLIGELGRVEAGEVGPGRRGQRRPRVPDKVDKVDSPALGVFSYRDFVFERF